MTPGNLELVDIILSWSVTLPAVAAIIVYDERRLRGPALERAWPPQSRDAAIFGLWNMGVHPLCLLVHFARTRRSIGGFLVGLGWLVAVCGVDVAARLGVDAVIEALGL
jgi:hypothetical protein